MSRLGEELAKINEGIGGETTGTSDAALEIKRIIKALDPDASTDGGTLENVIKIRELVEAGAGGGSVQTKTINIENAGSTAIMVIGYIKDGVYSGTRLAAGETCSAVYVVPDEQGTFDITLRATMSEVNIIGETPSGMYFNVDATASLVRLTYLVENNITIRVQAGNVN